MLMAATGRVQSTTQKQSQDQGNDVVRVNTELVQTDVMVFDKRGHFVDGLKPEQFALKIDGKPQPISFFERVTAGRNLAEATAKASLPATNDSTKVSTSRGRTLIFFIDDFHLALSGLVSTSKSLLHFIVHGIKQKDVDVITFVIVNIVFILQFKDVNVEQRVAV